MYKPQFWVISLNIVKINFVHLFLILKILALLCPLRSFAVPVRIFTSNLKWWRKTQHCNTQFVILISNVVSLSVDCVLHINFFLFSLLVLFLLLCVIQLVKKYNYNQLLKNQLLSKINICLYSIQLLQNEIF